MVLTSLPHPVKLKRGSRVAEDSEDSASFDSMTAAVSGENVTGMRAEAFRRRTSGVTRTPTSTAADAGHEGTSPSWALVNQRAGSGDTHAAAVRERRLQSTAEPVQLTRLSNRRTWPLASSERVPRPRRRLRCLLSTAVRRGCLTGAVRAFSVTVCRTTLSASSSLTQRLSVLTVVAFALWRSATAACCARLARRHRASSWARGRGSRRRS